MVDITVTLVKKLRDKTGAAIMECKKALVNAQGDIALAIDNLRKSGQAKIIKKTDRITAAGIILIKIAQDSKFGIMIELNCETDFAANNSNIRSFGNEIISTALNEHIVDIDTLKVKFEEQRIALISKIGENINIRRLGVLKGDLLGSYLHGIRIGVIVSASCADVFVSDVDKKIVRDVAMHISAIKPEYISINDIPGEVIAHERQIQFDIAMQSGKSSEIVEKIVEGSMRKFTNEISLINQFFVKDPSKTVGQLLEKYNIKINKFIRFELGEDLEKVKMDLSGEVAAIGKLLN